jgi:uncharacterized metal-binding protein YceD (DUF177 family)
MRSAIAFDVIDEHGPQAYECSFEIAAAELDRDEVAKLGDVHLEVDADKGEQPREYIADGAVGFTADLTCSRCLEPYPFAVTSKFHIRFRPRPEVFRENEEVEIGDKEELDVEFYSERDVPLRDLALEQVQLSIPMKPLCDERCLGLCPTCGANRSIEGCSCQEPLVDERWGALKNFREELAKKKNT